MRSLITGLAAGAAMLAAVSANAQQLAEIAGDDYAQLVSEKRAVASECEIDLKGGRWSETCDAYRAVSERLISRQLIALDWCEARMKDLQKQYGKTIPIPPACDQVMTRDAAELRQDKRITTMMAQMNPAGAARAAAVTGQILGDKSPAGTP